VWFGGKTNKKKVELPVFGRFQAPSGGTDNTRRAGAPVGLLDQPESSIPSHWYFDADHYQRELKAVWYREMQ